VNKNRREKYLKYPFNRLEMKHFVHVFLNLFVFEFLQIYSRTGQFQYILSDNDTKTRRK